MTFIKPTVEVKLNKKTSRIDSDDIQNKQKNKYGDNLNIGEISLTTNEKFEYIDKIKEQIIKDNCQFDTLIKQRMKCQKCMKFRNGSIIKVYQEIQKVRRAQNELTMKTVDAIKKGDQFVPRYDGDINIFLKIEQDKRDEIESIGMFLFFNEKCNKCQKSSYEEMKEIYFRKQENEKLLDRLVKII